MRDADALADLGRVGRAGAEHELRARVDGRRRVEQVLEPFWCVMRPTKMTYGVDGSTPWRSSTSVP